MDIFLIYILFAVTTSVASLYELIWPVLRMQETKAGKLPNKSMYLFVCLCINILIAPLIFLSCIVPSFGVRFRIALQEALFPED